MMLKAIAGLASVAAGVLVGGSSWVAVLMLVSAGIVLCLSAVFDND